MSNPTFYNFKLPKIITRIEIHSYYNKGITGFRFIDHDGVALVIGQLENYDAKTIEIQKDEVLFGLKAQINEKKLESLTFLIG
jgi:hypothetical protein